MPPNARRFIERVSALAGVPVWVTSVGPGRGQTIVSHDPFGDPFSAPLDAPSVAG